LHAEDAENAEEDLAGLPPGSAGLADRNEAETKAGEDTLACFRSGLVPISSRRRRRQASLLSATSAISA
jgi:hypothetical protein